MTKRRASSVVTQNVDVSCTPKISASKPQKPPERTILTKMIASSCMALVLSVILYEFRYSIIAGANTIFEQKPEQSDTVPEINTPIPESGWRVADADTDLEYGSSYCTIDRRPADQMTEAEFESVYRYKKPVILTFKDGAAGWTDPSKWTVASLKKEYGERIVWSGNSREIVRRGGNGYTDTSFTDYVDTLMSSEDSVGDPYYVFDRSFYNLSRLPSTLHPPSYIQIKDGVDDSIFFLGSSRSGVSFHKHADAWNGVVFGRKRWFLYPPETTPPGGVFPGYTQMEWYHNIFPKLGDHQRPLECVQEQGEILYIPEGMYHGTINLGDTIAIGIQKKESATKYMKLLYRERKLRRAMRNTNDAQTQQRVQKSIKLLEKLIKMLPDNSEMTMELGQMYKMSGDLDKALKYSTRAVEMDPFFVIAMLHLAEVYSELGDLDKSEALYNKSMELNPKLWDNYVQYGDFLVQQKRFKDAVDIYKKVTELEPNMVGLWQELLSAQQQSGDMEGARQTQTMIRKLSHPDNKHTIR